MSKIQKLSPAKFGLLGFQHMFAMFGATVLVPTLTGLSVSATLLFAGLGTLLFHLITKGKVPAFLGSSFAFLGGYFAVAAMEQFAGEGAPNWIPYAGVGVAVAGLIYCVVAFLFKLFGAEKVMRFFPPIVTGPIIIAIGLILSNSAVNNCAANWPIALLALGGPAMWDFSITMLLGIFIGTYSSIYIASPVVLYFDSRGDLREGSGELGFVAAVGFGPQFKQGRTEAAGGGAAVKAVEAEEVAGGRACFGGDFGSHGAHV